MSAMSEFCSSGFMWCPGRESNSHRLLHTILSRARLPFRHPGFIVKFSYFIAKIKETF